jgi:hypothetical protein
MKLKFVKKKSDYRKNNTNVHFKLYIIFTKNGNTNFWARENFNNYVPSR